MGGQSTRSPPTRQSTDTNYLTNVLITDIKVEVASPGHVKMEENLSNAHLVKTENPIGPHIKMEEISRHSHHPPISRSVVRPTDLSVASQISHQPSSAMLPATQLAQHLDLPNLAYPRNQHTRHTNYLDDVHDAADSSSNTLSSGRFIPYSNPFDLTAPLGLPWHDGMHSTSQYTAVEDSISQHTFENPINTTASSIHTTPQPVTRGEDIWCAPQFHWYQGSNTGYTWDPSLVSPSSFAVFSFLIC